MDLDLLSLKLHVDDHDHVWYVAGDGPAVNSGLPPVGFLLQPQCEIYQNYRVMGSHNNLQLILGLYLRRLETNAGVIEVCSPLACTTRNCRSNPRLALSALRTFDGAPSTGGWHVFSQGDYFTYALANHLRKMDRVDDTAIRLFKSHPVYPALSFVPHLDTTACCYLLAAILDPRWYNDPAAPGRGSRLRSYLGLDPKTVGGLLGAGQRHYGHERCKLAISAWSGDRDLNRIGEPDYFLYRVFKKAATRGIVLATLRTTQKFIDFLRLTWLAALTPPATTQLESLFVPKYFFKSDAEVDAFYQHLRKVGR